MSEGHNTKFYKTKINESLASVSDLKHLNKFFARIPLYILKKAVGQIINDDAFMQIPLRALYYEVRSIDEIIPKDIIQHIISFQGLDLENTKIVNKRWNQLSQINEKRILLEMEEHENQNGLDYDDNINKTWIISSKRNQLTKSESDRGFKIATVVRRLRPGEYFQEHVIDISNSISGDRYFIYPGLYQFKNPLLLLKKNLSFIGVASSRNFDGLYSGVSIYFQDIPFREYAISVKECHLRISMCKFRTIGYGIYCGIKSSLSLIKTQIEAGSRYSAITIDNGNKVVIKESLIRGSKYCIEMINMIEKKGKKLVCTNNIFKNIYCYCIINRGGRITGRNEWNEKGQFEMDKKYESYQISNNDLRWSHRKPITQNHNRIYVYKRDLLK